MRLLSPSVALLRTQTDERLVVLARQGHEAAFTAMVERYRKPMLAACGRFLPEARAEDAVQQTFVAAWRALQRGDDVQDLRPWLYKIARNTALNALRTPGYDAAEMEESLRVSEAPQDELERRDAIRRTLAGLAALPERQREALLRSAVEGASHADIARDLGLSEGATRQLVLRARTTMRSAASAFVPLPLLQWMAGMGGQPTLSRVAEVAAGAGSAGLVGTLAKAGAVVAIAGTAVAGPSVIDRPTERASAKTSSPASAGTRGASSPATAAPAAKPSTTAGAPSASTGTVVGTSRRGSFKRASRHGEGSDDHGSPSESGTSTEAGDDSGSRGGSGSHSGTGSGGSGSGSGSSGSGSGSSGSTDDSSGSGSGSSHGGDSGSHSDDQPSATSTPQPLDDGGTSNSGSGSGDTSGSGSSGSSGSGSSGSGSGDSGSSHGGEPDPAETPEPAKTPDPAKTPKPEDR